MLKLGNTDIDKIYLNNSEVTKILLGETQVYPPQSALEGTWEILYEQNGRVVDSNTVDVDFPDGALNPKVSSFYSENGYNRVQMQWIRDTECVNIRVAYGDGTGTNMINAKSFDLYEHILGGT